MAVKPQAALSIIVMEPAEHGRCEHLGPEDFMFQLTKAEFDNLRYQSGASSFKVVFDAIRELMTPPVQSKRRIGFKAE